VKYLNKKTALKLCSFVLLLLGVLDIIRGFTHTFRVRYAAEYLAKIEPTSDSLVLMSAFGISNFLTGFLYFLIVFKANKITPYVLTIIPISYMIGGIGMQYSNVVLESEFRGQHMMKVYLGICLLTAILYFTLSQIENKHKVSKPQTIN
jgi:hypothetical protein